MSDRDTRTVMIVGATSDIARAVAHKYARNGANLQLVARDHKRLESDADDIRIRHSVQVTLYELDITDLDIFDEFVDALSPLPDIVISAAGHLGDQEHDQNDVRAHHTVMMANYVGPCCLFGIFADRFAIRGNGVLVGISSVAGDRGRSKNYVYGSAKSGFTAYLSGLRSRFSATPITVITVKPGFVETQMTKNLALPNYLTVSPQLAATNIYQAINKSHDITYINARWRIIMTIINILPERLFKRMKV